MASKKRAAITAQTLAGIGAEVADMPISEDKANALAPAYESLLVEIAKLRSLSLKEVEPAMVFYPLRSKRNRRDD